MTLIYRLGEKCNFNCFLNDERPLFMGSETGKAFQTRAAVEKKERPPRVSEKIGGRAENETRLSEGGSDLGEKRWAGDHR